MDLSRILLAALAVLLFMGCDPTPDESASAAALDAVNQRRAAEWQQRNEFRELALTVLRSLDYPCPLTLKRDRFHTRAAVREQLTALRRRLIGDYAREFGMAEAQLEAGRAIPECEEPDRPGTADRIREADARDSAAISRMEEIARAN